VSPALLNPAPDIEYWAWLNVRHLGRITVAMFGASEVDGWGWARSVSLQVDCRAANRARCVAMADQARRLIMALPWTPWVDGVVASADCTDGPYWLAAEDGQPRYVLRFVLVVHPHQVRP
jgi:hypothetical protein